ncbi:hypothetical protein HZB02_07715 [Candidatus Woesearchaeota archaeon]|nr:hypothetical protein [Candidatus Woesearchaeota archaeon]
MEENYPYLHLQSLMNNELWQRLQNAEFNYLAFLDAFARQQLQQRESLHLYDTGALAFDRLKSEGAFGNDLQSLVTKQYLIISEIRPHDLTDELHFHYQEALEGRPITLAYESLFLTTRDEFQQGAVLRGKPCWNVITGEIIVRIRRTAVSHLSSAKILYAYNKGQSKNEGSLWIMDGAYINPERIREHGLTD